MYIEQSPEILRLSELRLLNETKIIPGRRRAQGSLKLGFGKVSF